MKFFFLKSDNSLQLDFAVRLKIISSTVYFNVIPEVEKSNFYEDLEGVIEFNEKHLKEQL